MEPKIYNYDKKHKFARTKMMVRFMSDNAMKRIFLNTLEVQRKGMGAPSKDITNRPVEIEDIKINGYADDIDLRIYKPEKKGVKPLICYFHGGGWYGGSIDIVNHFCMALADKCNAVVTSVNYHLMPEYPFPNGMEDCYQSILYAVSQWEYLNIDVNQVMVAGDSAGGNLAVAMGILALERREFKIHSQLLLYPVVDVVNLDLKSFRQEVYMAKGLKNIRELYVTDVISYGHPYVSPMNYSFIEKLPRTFIAVSEIDGLRDQDLLFAEKLDKAGVEVECVLFKGKKHAFIDGIGYEEAATDVLEEIANFVNQGIDR